MAYVTLRNVDLAFGGEPLLEDASLDIEGGERVCLLGRNGCGKSSLLGLLSGALEPDAGAIRRDPGTRIAMLPQSVPANIEGTVRAVVASALDDVARSHRDLQSGDAASPGTLERAQRDIEAADGWNLEARVGRTLSRLDLEPEADFTALSGGLQRRALLARALVARPDLLLLDEPTNHLDIDAIEWLEGIMLSWRGAVLFTTHDRRLLERAATRILELDRGALTSWPGDYANYLRRREERSAAEAQAHARLDRKLAAEEVWIRQGIRARRTRNEGRVRALERMRVQRAKRRDRAGTARFGVQAAEASGRRVAQARQACFSYDGRRIVENLTTLVERGDRIGIIGPNGSGKTTLLRLLLGELIPTGGEVIVGARVEVAYFDQHRAGLDEATSVGDSVAGGADFVTVNGAPRHIVSYLQDFLFTPDRVRQAVGALSGGERARLLLARLFARPSNLLVLDEPTNDLDAETLELLEERLLEYPGTLLLVSHDRKFLDNVVTSTLVLEGDGRVGEYVGGYSDWVRQRPVPPSSPSAQRSRPRTGSRRAITTSLGSGRRAQRLGFNEKRELEALPARIEALEQHLEVLNARLADPDLYRRGGPAIAAAREEHRLATADLEAAYARWSELESLTGGD